MTQNGFYHREPLSLINPYKPYQNAYLLPLDERMLSDTCSSHNNVFHRENLLYKPNEEILRDIEKQRKEKEYDRLRKEREKYEEMKKYSV